MRGLASCCLGALLIATINCSSPAGAIVGPTSGLLTGGSSKWSGLLTVSLLVDPFFTRSIRSAEFYIDGKLISRQTFTPNAEASVDFSVFDSFSSGQHVAAIKITAQERSPTTYELSGLGSFSKDRDQLMFDCPTVKRALTTGEQMTCSFTLR